MKLDFDRYRDKVAACWIGKNIGGTMGGPYEHSRTLLDVRGFATEPGEPLPNDDLDLQLVWLHALENVGPQHIDADTLGELWLSFITPHWNEYGVAKANLMQGLRPGLTGDCHSTWKHSNGAWIRTEIWACAAPALPALAAWYAIEDARVDHGCGEGTVAAAFVAAMQSAAFGGCRMEECIAVGMAAIPAGSRVAQSVRLVQECYRSGREWTQARNAVQEQNADIGTGWFEAPSNVAYAVLGLLYGEGDFKRSMLTAINCGDDTDCTAATVGATMGLLYGTAGIPADWSAYIGDKIVTISLSRGTVGKSFPSTCTELGDRIARVAPAVLQYYSGRYDKHRPYTVTFGEEDIPADAAQLFTRAVEQAVQPLLDKAAPYTMEFSHTLLRAAVTLSAPRIAPGGSVDVHIEFSSRLYFENQPYTLALRWILPDGFTAQGERTVFLPGWDIHTDPVTGYDCTLTAGETVAATERVVLEVLPAGRHTALYISFVLMG